MLAKPPLYLALLLLLLGTLFGTALAQDEGDKDAGSDKGDGGEKGGGEKGNSEKESSAQNVKKSEKRVCYEGLGCFSMEYPHYTVPDRPLPTPEDPNTLFAFMNFFSRQQPNRSTIIPLYGNLSLYNATFKASRPLTIFIMAGGGQGGAWPFRLKDAFLSRVDANVFYVNTSVAYRGLQVLKAASNVRVVGVQLAKFVKFLQVNYGLKPNQQVWMVAYGLGAHLAGYAGSRVPLARITGLEPMQEFFEGYPDEVRLDRTDAIFVDVVHTDARPFIPDVGFGMTSPIGHVDFYVNSGENQPGCRKPAFADFQAHSPDFFKWVTQIWAVIASSLYCHHKRAFTYFISAIKNTDCILWGHPVSMGLFSRAVSNGASNGIYVDLTAIRTKCNVSTCVPMGLYTQKSSQRGIFIVTTTASEPWCTVVDQNVPTRDQGLFQIAKNYLLSLAGL